MPKCTPTQHNNKKIFKKWAGGVIQVVEVELLPSKCKSLSSTPCGTKKKTLLRYN
jgi:hypothetical protein